MAGFDAASAVQELKWKFKPDVDAEGTVPEPSDKLIDEFWASLRDLTEAATNDDAMKKLASDAAPEIATKMAALFGSLCQECPSTEQILELPYRKRQAFYGWVVGQLANPE